MDQSEIWHLLTLNLKNSEKTAHEAFSPGCIVEENTVRVVNSAVYAMQVLQEEMAGEAERTGLTSTKTEDREWKAPGSLSFCLL